jgi:hypothetical protein
VLTEKIKRDMNRVNINKLTATDIQGNDLTGGYILKLDKLDGSSSTDGFYSNFLPFAGSAPHFFMYEYPDGYDIQPGQKNYIQQQVNNFETALHGDQFKDPAYGYRPYIDIRSFIDVFIITELAKNVDGFRVSSFYIKP